MAIHEQFGTVVPVPSQTQQRMKDIEGRLGKAAIDGSLTEPELNGYFEEYRTLQSKAKAYKYRAGSDSAESPFRDRTGERRALTQGKAVMPGPAESPSRLSETQWKSLFDSAVSRQAGFTVKSGFSDGSGIGLKSPTGEGSPGSLLPPELIPTAFERRSRA
jgi:hypothetical protein